MALRPASAVRRSVAVILLLACCTVAACGDDGGPSSAAPEATTVDVTTAVAPAPVGGLLATVGTNRLYQPRRQLGLALSNVGDVPAVVTAVQLRTDRFERVPLEQREVVLQPGGRRLVLPLPYGETRCGPSAGGGFVALVVLDDGSELRVPAPEEYEGAVARLHERECAAARVRELVEVTFEGTWERDGNALSGTMVVSRFGPGPHVAIQDVVGNVIFTVRTAARATPVLELGSDEARDEVAITVSADRCDSHAVAEFKRPFVFLSWISIDGAAATPVELEPRGPAREALEELLASC